MIIKDERIKISRMTLFQGIEDNYIHEGDVLEIIADNRERGNFYLVTSVAGVSPKELLFVSFEKGSLNWTFRKTKFGEKATYKKVKAIVLIDD